MCDPQCSTDPSGLALDVANNVYVGDVLNHVIRRITPAGVVTTFAGNGTVPRNSCACLPFHPGHGHVTSISAMSRSHKVRKLRCDVTVKPAANTPSSDVINTQAPWQFGDVPVVARMDAVPRKVHRVVVRSVAELASTELTQSPERRDREGGKPIAERERSVAKVYDEAQHSILLLGLQMQKISLK